MKNKNNAVSDKNLDQETHHHSDAFRPNLSTFCSPQSLEASRLPQYKRLPNPTSELDCRLQATLCMNPLKPQPMGTKAGGPSFPLSTYIP